MSFKRTASSSVYPMFCTYTSLVRGHRPRGITEHVVLYVMKWMQARGVRPTLPDLSPGSPPPTVYQPGLQQTQGDGFHVVREPGGGAPRVSVLLEAASAWRSARSRKGGGAPPTMTALLGVGYCPRYQPQRLLGSGPWSWHDATVMGSDPPPDVAP